MDHQPFGRIKGKGLRMLHTSHVLPELGADKSRTGVGCVDVHPDAFFCTCRCDRGEQVVNKKSSLVFSVHRRWDVTTVINFRFCYRPLSISVVSGVRSSRGFWVETVKRKKNKWAERIAPPTHTHTHTERIHACIRKQARTHTQGYTRMDWRDWTSKQLSKLKKVLLCLKG